MHTEEYLYPVKMKKIVKDFNRSNRERLKYSLGRIDFIINNRVVRNLEQYVTHNTEIYVHLSVLGMHAWRNRHSMITRGREKRAQDNSAQFVRTGLR